MIIGIHDSPGSFSDRWLTVCIERGIEVRRINCLASDAVEQCRNVDGMLWHFVQSEPRNRLMTRELVHALEAGGTLVFPNVATSWHYDDKIAQKYLLEAINAPLIKTWVFTAKTEAMAWIQGTTWPKVFKLRCGAGSRNVRLVRTRDEAEALCRQAFGRGFAAIPGYFSDMRTRLGNTGTWRALVDKLFRAPTVFLRSVIQRRYSMRERGYLYFQEFLPSNEFDTRITIIGNRAFAFLRKNRPGDFRASGSGKIVYDKAGIDPDCLKVAFTVAQKLGTQSLAFDFLFDSDREPRIGEISYCYMPDAVYQCPGYWNRNLEWTEGHVWPQDAILDDLITTLKFRNT